jgi:alpha-aminoadipic semialdehyde synthase
VDLFLSEAEAMATSRFLQPGVRLLPPLRQAAPEGWSISSSSSGLRRNLNSISAAHVVGVVRETYGMWERRAPLSPSHVERLVSGGWRVQVQPSSRRIYPDATYAAAGAEMTEDLQESTVVLGVKQVPIENLLPNRAYMFFSHTIKAQLENMALLDACIEKNIRLYDYECIAKDGKRLVAFGQYAGIVGMADILQGLGQRLLADGYSTPFLQVPLCYMQPSLEAAEQNIRSVGQQIATEGLPAGMGPLIFAFTGTGNVAKGAKRIFELLPFEMIEADELADKVTELERRPEPLRCLYGVNLDFQHLVQPSGGGQFSKQDYYANPVSYEPVFHEKVAPHISVLINGMYWDPRFPRLLTIDQLRKIATSSSPMRLRAISDITCDIDGSVENTTRSTRFEQPYYEWDAFLGCEAASVGSSAAGVVMGTVDILPTGLAREATQHFGDALLPILGNCLEQGISEVLKTACITDGGRLQERYEYIMELREQKEKAELRHTGSEQPRRPRRVLLAQGHLFDSKFINTAFDVIEKRGDFEILDFHVTPNAADVQRESQITLAISADTEKEVEDLYNDLEKLGSLLEVRLQEPTPSATGPLDVQPRQGNSQRTSSTAPNTMKNGFSPPPVTPCQHL